MDIVVIYTVIAIGYLISCLITMYQKKEEFISNIGDAYRVLPLWAIAALVVVAMVGVSAVWPISLTIRLIWGS